MKDKKIKSVSKACNIADSILKDAILKIKNKKFKTEKDIENFLKKESKKRNVSLSFPPVVATEKNGYEIHHTPNKTKIKRGFLIIDFGVKYKGYCSDCTRTLFLGKPTKEEKELYNLVLKAQETALINATPKTSVADLDLLSRQILIDFFDKYPHCLGHGVGKKIHQKPSVCPKNSYKLKKNDIITIEPGIYIKNKLGIRIEDTILIKENPIILTKINKKMVIINGYSKSK